MKTLFLDFDGVLHPSTAILNKDMPTLALQGIEQLLEGGLFQWRSQLEQALSRSESEQEIAIVVHSSWRNQTWMSSALARELLGPLGHRFAGFVEQHEPRERAITKFIDRMQIEEFLILDDAYAEFSVLHDRLLVTNPLLGVSDPQVLAQIGCWSRPESEGRCKRDAVCTA
jgi:hypothetical protein